MVSKEVIISLPGSLENTDYSQTFFKGWEKGEGE